VTGEHPAAELAGAVADRLSHPDTAPGLPTGASWWRQSLAHGIPGITLLHIELSAAGLRPWQRAHDWLTYATRGPATTGADSFLFYGAPALAHALACAAEQRPGSYQRALATLDTAIAADARTRLDAAHARIDRGRPAADFTEFDTLRGLTGIGAYLLRRSPGSMIVRAVLEYLVRLTEPIHDGSETLPGWWTACGPSGRPSDDFPDGHANTGVAHGIGGPLALLALAALRGVMVAGHREAIGRICAWLDRWRITTGAGVVWPYWVTRAQLRAGRLDSTRPLRPSWCYGTAGLARAQQLAALATGDTGRRTLAENALACALTDPGQRAATIDPSLCHGHAGLAHLTLRAAADAAPAAAARLHALLPSLLDVVHPAGADPCRTAAALLRPAGCGPGFLEGAAGVALGVLAAGGNAPPCSAWDACLLIT
jgi:hypothetical protein